MKLVTTLLLLLPIFVFGQQSYSLEQAQNYALENNRGIKKSVLEIEKAKQIVKETWAIGLPQINASAELNNFLDIPVTVLPDFISPSVYGVLLQENLIDEGDAPGEAGLVEAKFGTDYTASGSIALNQLIFDGSYLVGLQSTKVFLSLSEDQKEIGEADIKKTVAQAYYNVLLAEENAKILVESKGTIEQTFREVEAMYKEGMMEENDVDQLSLLLTNIENSISNARRQKELAEQMLKLQMGIDQTTSIALTEEWDGLVENSKTSSSDSEFSLSLLPEVKLLENNIRSKELLIKYEKSKYLPSLVGFVSHSQSAQREEFNIFDGSKPWFPTTVWGLKLQVPIFSSGMKHHKVNQSKIDLEMALLDKQDAEDGLSLSALKAKSDLQFAKESLNASEKSFNLSKKIRDKTLTKYKEGLASSFELNQAETQHLESQGSYLLSGLNLLNSKEAYKRAYGY